MVGQDGLGSFPLGWGLLSLVLLSKPDSGGLGMTVLAYIQLASDGLASPGIGWVTLFGSARLDWIIGLCLAEIVSADKGLSGIVCTGLSSAGADAAGLTLVALGLVGMD